MTSLTFFLFFIPILAIVLLLINFLLAPHKPNKYKDSQFECGFSSFRQMSRLPFNISFFVYALLFLLFDLEILLVYPFVVSASNNSIYGLIVMLLFFILLTIGFVFELGKKALEIDSRQKLNSFISIFNRPIPKPHAFINFRLSSSVDPFTMQIILDQAGKIIINITCTSDYLNYITSIISGITVPIASIAEKFISLAPYHMLDYPTNTEYISSEAKYNLLHIYKNFPWNNPDFLKFYIKSHSPNIYDILYRHIPSPLTLVLPPVCGIGSYIYKNKDCLRIPGWSFLHSITSDMLNPVTVFVVDTSPEVSTEDTSTEDTRRRERLQRNNANFDRIYAQIMDRINIAGRNWTLFWDYVNTVQQEGTNVEIQAGNGSVEITHRENATEGEISRAIRVNTQLNTVVGHTYTITQLIAKMRYYAWLIQMDDPTFIVSEEVIMHSFEPILEQTQNLYNINDFTEIVKEIFEQLIKTHYQENPSDKPNDLGKRNRDDDDPDIGSSTKRLNDLTI